MSGGPEAGFLDRQIGVGGVWPEELARALGTCQVFVPVLNKDYCSSEWCGKEWAGFVQRLKSQQASNGVSNGTSYAAIVPVLWVARKRCHLAPMVPSLLQLTSLDFPDEYEAEGIYALRNHSRWADAYKQSVWELAKRIYDEGEKAKLAPSEPVEWDSVPNAFADHQALDGREVLVRIAAYPADRPRGAQAATPTRPPRGKAYYYGHKTLEWAPYRTENDPWPIAARVRELVIGMNHSPLLESVYEAADLDSRSAPSIVLVDPWAAGVPELVTKLQRIDEGPAHVVVPWNEEDSETMGREELLRSNLNLVLPRSRSLTSHVLKSDFRTQFKNTIIKAIKNYIETTTAYPPPGQASMERPLVRPESLGAGDADG